MKIILLSLITVLSSYAQDIKLTPDMYEYSENSLTGVYLCTPKHVEDGDCKDVDQEYYENLARLSLGMYEIGLLSVNNEETIAFKGPLSPGAAENLISILKRYPHIKTLTLSSQGGSLEDAYEIAAYVEKHQISTWVPVRRICLSACVPIFLSGKTMTLDGQLGLHTGTFQLHDPYQIKDLETARKTIQEAVYKNDQFMLKRVRLFIKLGIPLTVINDMIEAKGDFLVFTSLEDLIQYNPKQNHIRSMKEMSSYSKSQEAVNFDFQNYQQLF